MSAYLVFIKEKTLDPAEMAVYQQEVSALLGTFGLKVLAAYGAQEILEGGPAEGVVIAEFPSAEDAKGWYNSPAYKVVRQHRFKGAEYRCILVQGV